MFIFGHKNAHVGRMLMGGLDQLLTTTIGAWPGAIRDSRKLSVMTVGTRCFTAT
jgi:hypothetical protein